MEEVERAKALVVREYIGVVLRRIRRRGPFGLMIVDEQILL